MQKQDKTGTDEVTITQDNDSGFVAESDNTASALREFAEHLDTARMLWQRYPELVQASEFPEPFLTSLRECGHEPGACELTGEDVLQEQGILNRPKA
jgi:hypothetical protein